MADKKYLVLVMNSDRSEILRTNNKLKALLAMENYNRRKAKVVKSKNGKEIAASKKLSRQYWRFIQLQPMSNLFLFRL